MDVCLVYCVHWNTLNARLAKKSLADTKPATGRSWKPVFPEIHTFYFSSSPVDSCRPTMYAIPHKFDPRAFSDRYVGFISSTHCHLGAGHWGTLYNYITTYN